MGWLRLKDRRLEGPFSEEDLREWLRQGHLLSSDYVISVAAAKEGNLQFVSVASVIPDAKLLSNAAGMQVKSPTPPPVRLASESTGKLVHEWVERMENEILQVPVVAAKSPTASSVSATARLGAALESAIEERSANGSRKSQINWKSWLTSAGVVGLAVGAIWWTLHRPGTTDVASEKTVASSPSSSRSQTTASKKIERSKSVTPISDRRKSSSPSIRVPRVRENSAAPVAAAPMPAAVESFVPEATLSPSGQEIAATPPAPIANPPSPTEIDEALVNEGLEGVDAKENPEMHSGIEPSFVNTLPVAKPEEEPVLGEE